MVAQLPKPGKSNLGTCVASCEKRPVGVVVTTLSTPGREQIKSLGDICTTRAAHIPRCLCTGSARAFGIRNSQIPEAESDIESGLVQLRGSVDGVDDILPQAVGGVEAGGVGAVGGNANKRNLACGWTASSVTNSGSQIDTSRVAVASAATIDVLALFKHIADCHCAGVAPKAIIPFQHQIAIDGVVWMSIKFQFVRTTGQAGTAFELDVTLSADIRISPNCHVLVVIFLQPRVEFVLGG